MTLVVLLRDHLVFLVEFGAFGSCSLFLDAVAFKLRSDHCLVRVIAVTSVRDHRVLGGARDTVKGCTKVAPIPVVIHFWGPLWSALFSSCRKREENAACSSAGSRRASTLCGRVRARTMVRCASQPLPLVADRVTVPGAATTVFRFTKNACHVGSLHD